MTNLSTLMTNLLVTQRLLSVLQNANQKGTSEGGSPSGKSEGTSDSNLPSFSPSVCGGTSSMFNTSIWTTQGSGNAEGESSVSPTDTPVEGATEQPASETDQRKAEMESWIAENGDKSKGGAEVARRFTEKGHEEANFLEPPKEATGRPEGDKRSADEIINDNPILKNLGNQKDIKKDEMKKQCGDWENEPDPEKRADAAFNAAKVLNYIDCAQNREGGERDNAGDGDLTGITSDGDARRGSEAGRNKDFAEQGYGLFADERKDWEGNKNARGDLDKTNDTHVRLNGSNKDNFQWGMGEVGKILSKIPILKSCLAPIFNAVGEGKGLGDTLAKAFGGLAMSAFNTFKTIARGPAGFAMTAVKDTVKIGVESTDTYQDAKKEGKDKASEVADLLF